MVNKNGLARVALFSVIGSVGVSRVADASVTPVDYFRLGEGDPGAANGGAGDVLTLDSSGNVAGANSLTKAGSPIYTSSVSPVATAKTGSTLAMSFPAVGDSYTTGTAATTATSNFGVEGWFNPSSASQASLAYTGNTGSSGFGLFVFGQHYEGLFGGVALLDSGVPVTPGKWTYFALVKDGGTTSLYIDSATAQPTTFTNTSNAAAAITSIATNGSGGDFYSGAADEVRFFTFEAGQFNASTDLLISAPEPASLSLLAVGSIGLLARRRCV